MENKKGILLVVILLILMTGLLLVQEIQLKNYRSKICFNGYMDNLNHICNSDINRFESNDSCIIEITKPNTLTKT